ncbi:uncharacterized protein EV420DRAFT_1043216 [Desarmillaria tabescens]|uniref:Zinc-finger domain-containing protein n=1 Tax=Armillaria tabescens TaxID=1929756 RepID=A0AA39NF07_ARMTA|nr:uncharacterized protein EV420DRAFT_1043216 [Desarmillaria tabescens]KAK0464440.1 hypothetical protein EV420DRAFT_1043216 [Desarmillaria tabescens]
MPHSDDRLDTLTEAVDVDVATSSSTQVTLSTNIQRQEENLGLLEQHQDEADQFTAYASLFSSYPLLRSWSTANDSAARTSEQTPSLKTWPSARALSSNTSTSLSSITSFSSFSTMPRSRSSSASSIHSDMHIHRLLPAPDLRLLKTATATKLLDPSKRICQYEIPGGGVCRDAGCEDIHPSRLNNQQSSPGQSMDPSGEWFASYTPVGSRDGVVDADTAAYLRAVVALPLGVDVSKIVGILEKLRLEHPTMVFDERVSRTLEILSTQPP